MKKVYLIRSLTALYILFPWISFFTTDYLISEAILLMLTTIALLTTTINAQKQVAFSKPFLYSLLLLVALCLLTVLRTDADMVAVSKHVLLISIAYFFYVNRKYLHEHFLSKATAISLSVMSCLFIVSQVSGQLMFYPNNSILSIILAGYVSFLIPAILRPDHRHWRWFYLAVGMLSVGAIILTGGRAGIAGLVVVMAIICWQRYRRKRRRLWFISMSIVAGSIMFASLLFFKTGSSAGRLLIYKVTFSALKPADYVVGIGYGNFKAKYTEYQSAYFGAHPTQSREAMLADNTYYAFNDYFQLIVETGLIGISIMLIVILLCYQAIRNLRRKIPDHTSEETGAMCAILCILTAGLFSYPLQVLSLLPFLLLCVANASSQIRKGRENSKNKTTYSGNARLLINGALTVAVLFVTVGILQVLVMKKQAERLNVSGFKLQAVNRYESIHKHPFEDRSMLYPYAVLLSDIHEFNAAENILNQSAKYIYNDQSAILKADLALKRNSLTEADSMYNQAVRINPKSFSNRFTLFNFYVNSGQIEKAYLTGKELIALQPKVPSDKVNKIKVKTASILDRLDHSNAKY